MKRPSTTAHATGPIGDGDERAKRMRSNPFMMALNRSRPTPAPAPAPAPAAAGIDDDGNDDGNDDDDDHFLTPLPKIPLPPPDPILYPDSEAEKYPIFTTADAETDGANSNTYKSTTCIGSMRERAWRFIRTFRDERKFTKATYNFRMDGYSLKQINDAVIGTFQVMKCQYKLNISLGYILYNAVEDRFRYHYPCMNNNGMFPLPMLVTCEDDVRKVIGAIDALDPQDWVTTMRPTTAWSLRAITNVTLILFKCPPFPIGAPVELPDYITNNKAIMSLVHSHRSRERRYNDNLCFFRCLALSQGATEKKNLRSQTLELFAKWCHHKEKNWDADTFQGVELDEMSELERCFGTNVYIYSLVPPPPPTSDLPDNSDNDGDDDDGGFDALACHSPIAESEIDEAEVAIDLGRPECEDLVPEERPGPRNLFIDDEAAEDSGREDDDGEEEEEEEDDGEGVDQDMEEAAAGGSEDDAPQRKKRKMEMVKRQNQKGMPLKINGPADLTNITPCAELVRRPTSHFTDTLCMNLYANHLSYIKNMALYCGVFRCDKCQRSFRHSGSFHRHVGTCVGNTKTQPRFPGGAFNIQPDLHELLRDEGFDTTALTPLKEENFMATWVRIRISGKGWGEGGREGGSG